MKLSSYDTNVFRNRAAIKIQHLELFLQHYQEVLGIDWSMKFDTAAECCWVGVIRITPEPNAAGPDESIVLYIAGADGPESACLMLVDSVCNVIDRLLARR